MSDHVARVSFSDGPPVVSLDDAPVRGVVSAGVEPDGIGGLLLGLRLRVSAVNPPPGPTDILAITDGGSGAPLVTTGGPHGMGPGGSVTISGTSEPTYNGTLSVTSVPSADTFVIAALFAGNSFGGRYEV